METSAIFEDEKPKFIAKVSSQDSKTQNSDEGISFGFRSELGSLQIHDKEHNENSI